MIDNDLTILQRYLEWPRKSLTDKQAQKEAQAAFIRISDQLAREDLGFISCGPDGPEGHDEISTKPTRVDRCDITDRARDFKLIETGFSYWATTLNRVAARLALGRVKDAITALQREQDEAEAKDSERRETIFELNAEITRLRGETEEAAAEVKRWQEAHLESQANGAAVSIALCKAEGEAKALRAEKDAAIDAYNRRTVEATTLLELCDAMLYAFNHGEKCMHGEATIMLEVTQSLVNAWNTKAAANGV